MDIINKENYFTYFSRFSEIQFILGALQLIPKEFESIPVYCISDDYEWALKYIPLISNSINKLIDINKVNQFNYELLYKHRGIHYA